MVAFMWLYVIIITTGYSSNLTAFLTVQRRPSSIETIRELYESKIPVVGLGEYFKYNMMQSVNKYVQGLAQNYRIVFSVEEQDALITQGMGVGIQGRKYLQYIIKKEYSPRGIPTVRILKECFMPHSLALGLQVHSPLKMQFDKVVSIVVESGLVNIWFQKSLSRSIKVGVNLIIQGGVRSRYTSLSPVESHARDLCKYNTYYCFIAVSLCLGQLYEE
ncbi:hypothetical protein O3P69_012292 [Scylla paramamosain]|uniref:Ionotropic glutamate receptor C-terminal domain-containing protein n=2 Tax=Scylla paramamosain TaxID=85552 RepID=A0AAW0TFI9_SCYPA